METKAVVLAGYKNSGKTTLASNLCDIFNKRGLKPGVVKFVHHGLDKEGTDTQKLSQVAYSVLGLSESETSLFWKKKSSLLDVIGLMDVDVLLIEGGRDEIDYIPRILLPKNDSEAKELDNGLTIGIWGDISLNNIPSYKNLEEMADLILDKGFALPNINCGACGRESCYDLAKDIVSGQASMEDCKSLHQEGITIKINDQPVAANPFVKAIIENTVRGLFSCLKGYTPGSKIFLEIKG